MAKKFHHSHEVCTCKHVSLGEVLHSIKERDADTIVKIAELTDAGTCCKSCIGPQHDKGVQKMELYLEQILNKFKKS